MDTADQHASNDPGIVGVHVVAELIGCDSALLDNEQFLVALLKDAAKAGGANILQTVSYSFSPQGVTVLLLLAESHMSIHTWPEREYAAVDLFTCGTSSNPELSVDAVAKALSVATVRKQIIRRGNSDE